MIKCFSIALFAKFGLFQMMNVTNIFYNNTAFLWFLLTLKDYIFPQVLQWKKKLSVHFAGQLNNSIHFVRLSVASFYLEYPLNLTEISMGDKFI
jgi:hypothetical protein